MSERFGNYEILRKLATGGMAEVFLAKHTSLGGFERLVCIKRILPHLGEQDDFINMFLDDAEQHGKLLEEAIKAKDPQAIIDEAHRIKGGAGQVGARDLQDLAATLEGMGRDSEFNTAEETYSIFEKEYERVSDYLREEMKS